MKRSIIGLAIAAAVGLGTAVVFAQIPVDGGSVGGSTTVVDNSAGEQIDPHVSANLAAYTDQATGAGMIRYYDFLTPGASGIIPSGDVWDVDELSDINGSHIAFARQHADSSRSCMVFDRTSMSTIEIAPGQGAVAHQTALGSDTVAFVNSATNDGDIVVGTIANPLASLVNLSNSWKKDLSPAVSPLGDAVVWESCEGAFVNCDIMKSTRSAGLWGAAQTLSDTTGAERDPDTDGILVVYDSNRAGALGGGDIFFQPISGGTETQVQLDGLQRNPSISGGVIAFESKAPGSTTWDLFVYQISTNTVFRVTDTPVTNEILNDITTLENGDVRVVWAADDDFFPGEHNIYAQTFTLPAATYIFTGFFQPVDNLPTLNVASAGSAIPVKFSLGGNQGLGIFAIGYPASSPIQCDASEPGAAIEETVNAGGSSVSYDAATDQYTYVWKTQRAWKGTCRMLVVRLSDNNQYLAKFRFR
jgi:hypothetical protein